MWIAGLIICFGWIFSLCLHEFSHALVAYWGGDKTVKDKGYLTFNPLKYTQPDLSIIMPLVFILIGGMGLPGGAVYINHSLLKNRVWDSLVSAAGPVSNTLSTFILIIPFWLLQDDSIGQILFWNDSNFDLILNIILPSLAYLIYIEVFAVIFNLLPIPFFDGYGIIKPWLPEEINLKLAGYSRYSYYFIFGLFLFVPKFSSFFFSIITSICSFLGVPTEALYQGSSLFYQPINKLITLIIIILFAYLLRYNEHNWYQKGNKLARQEQDEDAIAAYNKAIKIKPDYVNAWLRKGDAYYRLKNYSEAIKAYHKVIEFNPEEYNAWLFIAHGSFIIKNYQQAVQAYEKIIELKSSSNSSDNYLYLAQSLFRLERHNQAIKVLDQGINLDSYNHKLWNYKSSCLYELKKYREVVELSKNAPKLNQENIEFYYYLASSLAKEKSYVEAENIFQEIIILNSEYTWALVKLAEIYYSTGDYTQAIDNYQKVVNIKSDDFTVWYNMACCYSLKYQVEQAIAALQKAIAIEPDKTIELIEQDEDLINLKDNFQFQNLIS